VCTAGAIAIVEERVASDLANGLDACSVPACCGFTRRPEEALYWAGEASNRQRSSDAGLIAAGSAATWPRSRAPGTREGRT